MLDYAQDFGGRKYECEIFFATIGRGGGMMVDPEVVAWVWGAYDVGGSGDDTV